MRAVSGHPDDVAGGGGVPVVAEAVDASAFEHEEAVLHVVDLYLREGGAGGVGHGVDGEVEDVGVGEEAADVEVGVAVEGGGGDVGLGADEEPGVGAGGGVVEVERVEGLEGLVDEDDAGGGEGGEGVLVAGGEVGVAAGSKVVGDLLAGFV